MIEFHLDAAQVIGLVLSAVLPLLVGLVTTRVTDGRVKAVLLAALTLATGLLTELLAAVNAGTTYDLGEGLTAGVTGFLIAVGLHFGLYKPTGLTDAVQAVGVTPKHRA